MSKYVPVGLALGALLGSAAFLVPVAGFAQAAPAPAAPAAAAPQSNTAAPKADAATAEEREKMRAAKKAFLDAKIAALHAGLELTPAQAPLWAPVETAIRDLWHGHDDEEDSHQNNASPTPLDWLKHRSQWLAGRAKALTALTDATGPLVASLDAAQKEHLPKLLEGAFKGRKMLFAAFNVASDEHESGHDTSDQMHKDGGEDQHARHHGHEDGGEEGHHWHHHHHHWHRHHHWGHHHWDHDDGDQEGDSGDQPGHDHEHGDRDRT